MEHDERVVLIGEDLRGGHGGNAPEEARIEAFGGVLGVTKGLWTQFGSDRVIDTPLPSRRSSAWLLAPQQRVCGRWRS
jgi:pyruvate dehydrogenase E1 component beta subunit